MVLNYGLLTAMIIAAELTVVTTIVVISEKLASSFQSDDFRYIKQSWRSNLFYVLFACIDTYCTFNNHNNNNYPGHIPVNILATFFDVLQFTLLFFAISKTKFVYPFKEIVAKIGYWWFLISVIPLSITLIG